MQKFKLTVMGWKWNGGEKELPIELATEEIGGIDRGLVLKRAAEIAEHGLWLANKAAHVVGRKVQPEIRVVPAHRIHEILIDRVEGEEVAK